MDETFVKITDLQQISDTEVHGDDLVLISHDTSQNDIDGNPIYLSKKLSMEDLKKIIADQVQVYEPDNDTIVYSDGKLKVEKVYFNSIIGLGNLATMSENDLNLSALSHMNIWTGTQSDYDSLASKNNNTLYFIR